jgi:FKBP-type peptidyl-prolyl cis-trans isomerase SlyD
MFLALAVVSMLSVSVALAVEGGKKETVVKNGSVVSLQYTLSGEDGKTIESNKGKKPLKYTHGSQQIIPGLEKELAGMKVGGEKRVKVKPEDGYGPVNPQGFQEFPKEKIPANGLKVGAVLMAKGPQGESIPVRVKEIKEKTVVLDLNHPLAGKTLVFDVKVLDIQQPEAAKPSQPPAPTTPPAQTK